jgi:Adenylate and Guanylate cyclase catalytic domain
MTRSVATDAAHGAVRGPPCLPRPVAGESPESARVVLDAVLERMMDAVHRHGGTVNQIMGDGIMALFGAPRPTADHARRACDAAVAMQEAIARYSEARPGDREVQIRVGIASGEVIVRSVGSDLRRDCSAVGVTTHVAARLEQGAPPGAILILRRPAAWPDPRSGQSHAVASPSKACQMVSRPTSCSDPPEESQRPTPRGGCHDRGWDSSKRCGSILADRRDSDVAHRGGSCALDRPGHRLLRWRRPGGLRSRRLTRCSGRSRSGAPTAGVSSARAPSSGREVVIASP